MLEISAAFRSDTFEKIHRISNEMIEITGDEALLPAFKSLHYLSGIILRVKKCWLKIFNSQPAHVNLEVIADLYFVLQHVKFYSATRFNRHFEDSLKEMFMFFKNNPEVQLNMARTFSLHPHEALTESLKTLDTVQRKLTNEMVEDLVDFLAQGAVMGNLFNSSLNGVLVFCLWINQLKNQTN